MSQQVNWRPWPASLGLVPVLKEVKGAQSCFKCWGDTIKVNQCLSVCKSKAAVTTSCRFSVDSPSCDFTVNRFEVGQVRQLYSSSHTLCLPLCFLFQSVPWLFFICISVLVFIFCNFSNMYDVQNVELDGCWNISQPHFNILKLDLAYGHWTQSLWIDQSLCISVVLFPVSLVIGCERNHSAAVFTWTAAIWFPVSDFPRARRVTSRLLRLTGFCCLCRKLFHWLHVFHWHCELTQTLYLTNNPSCFHGFCP